MQALSYWLCCWTPLAFPPTYRPIPHSCPFVQVYRAHPWGTSHCGVSQNVGRSCCLRWQVFQEGVWINQAELTKVLKMKNNNKCLDNALKTSLSDYRNLMPTIAKLSTCLVTACCRKYWVRNWFIVGAARSNESTLSTRCSILNTCFFV